MQPGLIQLATNAISVDEILSEVLVNLIRVDGSDGAATVIKSRKYLFWTSKVGNLLFDFGVN